ncbi:MAG TPA: hypothetical protein VFM59_08080 [Salinimicrobium sp.]|nr:hypothetical protein [Salinimicrobium sp.]
MKKVILILALLFSASTTLISCRDAENDPVEESIEEAGDNVEDAADEVEDEF